MDENWKAVAYDIRTRHYDLVIHAGANADSQYDDPAIFADQLPKRTIHRRTGASQHATSETHLLLDLHGIRTHELVRVEQTMRRDRDQDLESNTRPPSSDHSTFTDGNEPEHRKSLPRKFSWTAKLKYLFKRLRPRLYPRQRRLPSHPEHTGQSGALGLHLRRWDRHRHHPI